VIASRRSSPTVVNALERPRFQTTGLALALRDQIRTATTTPALPGGNGS